MWCIKRGDLVKIFSSRLACTCSYGIVTSPGPYADQLSLFPVVLVYSFSNCQEIECFPYNLEIVSASA